MKKIKFMTLFAIIALFGVLSMQSCTKTESTNVFSKNSYIELNSAMHKLWAEHMQWTYMTVDAFFHNPNSLENNLNRLLQNQKDIGNAIVPYYGQEAGDELSNLLTEHIELAVPVLTAAQNNDANALEAALNDWYRNADDIAHFLSAANPTNWEKSEMEHMMKMHIDQTVEYSVALLNNDYATALQKYDEAFQHMMEDMAKMLSEGIAKQFPEKFVN